MAADIGIGKWKVTVLDCGNITLKKGAMTVGHDGDLTYTIPYLAYLLQDGTKNVLIDNGIKDTFIIDGKAWGGNPADAGTGHFLRALEKAGVTPEDIDDIIFTHLHNDHAGNSDLFPTVKMIAQKDEWYNLNCTVFAERQRRDYDLEVIPVLSQNKNLLLIDGDMDYLEGIKIIKTPGHTRGSQSIVVNTTEGLRVFVGDLFHTWNNAFPTMETASDIFGHALPCTPAPADYPTIPSSLVYNYYDYYASVDKVKAYLPGPEPEYLVCGHESTHLFRV